MSPEPELRTPHFARRNLPPLESPKYPRAATRDLDARPAPFTARGTRQAHPDIDVGFTWDLPTIAAARIDRIVAYGFGNRANAASGNTPTNGANQTALPDPGPVNEALADAVYAIRRLKSVKVYAQWEIARFLASKYQMADVHSIEPVVAADGSITYLSTDGVAAAIVALEGGGAAMGGVAVVGHRDHAKRCIQTSRARGMAAAAVAEVPLPTLYEPQSGQAWTRRRDLYLVHDMYAQFATLRANLIAAAYPNG